MNLLKNIKTLLSTILVLLTVEGCGVHFVIKDRLVYGDLGKFGAMETHTLFTEIKPIRIHQPDWDQKRIGMTCTATDNITDIIALIDKMCASHKGECEYEKLLALKKAIKSIVIAQMWNGVQFSRETMKYYELNR